MYIYESTGTLGKNQNDRTCSIIAANEWNKAKTIKAYNQFELAIDDLKKSIIDTVFVPGAYPNISNFIMDSAIQVSEVSLHKIPPLVLANTEQNLQKVVNTIFHHPATTSLLQEVKVAFMKNMPVSSNSEACISLLENCGENAAVTNLPCAEMYNLHVHQILRNEIIMPFICFTLKRKPLKN